AAAASGHARVLRAGERVSLGRRAVPCAVSRGTQAPARGWWRGAALHAQRQRRQAQQPAVHAPRLRGRRDAALMRVGFDVTVSARARTGVAVYARELWPALVEQGLDVRRWQQGIGV